MNKKLYRAPQMELHALRVEKGFAQTGGYDSNGMQLLDSYGTRGTDDANYGLE